MTKEEFRDQIDSMDELISFCCENDRIANVVDDITDECSFDEIFSEYVFEQMRCNGWECVRSAINNAACAKDDLQIGYFNTAYLDDVYAVTDDDFWSLLNEAEEAYEDQYGFDEDKDVIQEAIAPIKDEEIVDATLLLELMG